MSQDIELYGELKEAILDPLDFWSKPTREGRDRVKNALTQAFLATPKTQSVPQSAVDAVLLEISKFAATFHLTFDDSVWTVEGTHTDVYRKLRYGALWFEPIGEPLALIIANLSEDANV
jgi:hypothetical protein